MKNKVKQLWNSNNGKATIIILLVLLLQVIGMGIINLRTNIQYAFSGEHNINDIIRYSNDNISLSEEDSFKLKEYNSENKRATDALQKIKNRADSIESVEEKIKAKAAEIAYNKTPAGYIHKLHPEWDKDDCELLAQSKIWIGMDIRMVVYLRGYPNDKNISNYGNGNEYQYCWTNYTINCFYCGEDGIVTSYN